MLQEAGAEIIDHATATGYHETTRELYKVQRDKLFDTLKKVGFNPMMAEGGYFLVARIDEGKDGEDLATYLSKQAGVTGIPMRAFYTKDATEDARKWLR